MTLGVKIHSFSEDSQAAAIEEITLVRLQRGALTMEQAAGIADKDETIV